MAENRRPRDGFKKRKVHIFTQVTAKIEPALLKRVEESRLRQVSQAAGVEVVKHGVDMAFQGSWKSVSRAQSALKSLYVKAVPSLIEDRYSTDKSHDDDKVSLRPTSGCGSALSSSSTQSRVKIHVGKLTERVNQSLERSSSRHSQYMSDDSMSKRHGADSDKEDAQMSALRHKNRRDENPTCKKTSMYSNLIHHKKSYIYKCAALAQAHKNEQENGGEASKLQQLMTDLPELQTDMPFEANEVDPGPIAVGQDGSSPRESFKSDPVTSPSPPSQAPPEPRYLPASYPPLPEPAYTNHPLYPIPEQFMEPRFPAPVSAIAQPMPEPVAPIPAPIPLQHPGFTFESMSHDPFYQNRGFVSPAVTFTLPAFPSLPPQEAQEVLAAPWDVHHPEPLPPPKQYLHPSPPNEYGCDLCDFRTPHRLNLLHHEKHAHAGRMHKCHLCEKSYHSKADLALHIRAHSTKYRCDDCGKVYKSSRLLKQHQLTHEGSYVKPTFTCPDCGKSFSTKYVLQNHVDNVHNGKQPAFVCSICDKRFTQKHSLTEHQNIHLGLKPFKCEACQKSFSFRTSLSQHMLLHSAERQYSCEVCGKAFLQKNSLRLHSAIHSENRAHCCSYCGKGFTQKQAMLRHERIHNGEKPYSCEICGRAFNDSSILRRHMHVHAKKQTVVKREVVTPHPPCQNDGFPVMQAPHPGQHGINMQGAVRVIC